MNPPDELRARARRLRDRAEEVHETNPTAAEYHERQAAWCEYLARQRDEEQRTIEEGGAR